jgi:hypothetical protein
MPPSVMCSDSTVMSGPMYFSVAASYFSARTLRPARCTTSTSPPTLIGRTLFTP